MFAKTVAVAPPKFTEAPPFVPYLRRVLRALLARFTRAAGSAERALVLEDRVAIGPRKTLVVVRCYGQRFLIATAGDTFGPVIEVVSPKPARRTHKERNA